MRCDDKVSTMDLDYECSDCGFVHTITFPSEVHRTDITDEVLTVCPECSEITFHYLVSETQADKDFERVQAARALLSEYEDVDTETRYGIIKHAIGELQNARRALDEKS